MRLDCLKNSKVLDIIILSKKALKGIAFLLMFLKNYRPPPKEVVFFWQ